MSYSKVIKQHQTTIYDELPFLMLSCLQVTYTLLAQDRWCDNLGGAHRLGEDFNGYTLVGCQAQCSKAGHPRQTKKMNIERYQKNIRATYWWGSILQIGCAIILSFEPQEFHIGKMAEEHCRQRSLQFEMRYSMLHPSEIHL